MSEPKNEKSKNLSVDDQKILDMYASYEHIRFGQNNILQELDEYQRLNKYIEAAEVLLAIIPVAKFSDIRRYVAHVAAQDYERRGQEHSLQNRKTHSDNIRAIADFSRSIELLRLANEKPTQSLFEARGYCYLEQKMSDKAIEDANSMINISDSSGAYLFRSQAYSQIGNYERSKADIIYAMEIADRIQEKTRAFALYSKVCIDIVNQHRLNLDEVLKQYKEGKRIFSGVDLSWIDLSNIDFSGADLQNANLECSDLSNTNLSDANLYSANLQNVINNSRLGINGMPTECTNFQNANLESANLRGASLFGANFQNANLHNAHMPKAQLDYANFKHANLTYAVLIKASLTYSKCDNCCFNLADLREAQLGGIDLNSAELIGANLSEANLQQARLFNANFEKANLSNSNLFEATAILTQFRAANLSNASLAQADLSKSNLQDANVSHANFYNVNLTGVNITNTNLIEADDLRDVEGISEEIIRQWQKREKR